MTWRVQQQRENPLVVFLRTRTLQSRGPGYRAHGVPSGRFYAEHGYCRQTPPCPEAVRVVWQPFVPMKTGNRVGIETWAPRKKQVCEGNPRILKRQGQRLREKQRGSSVSGLPPLDRNFFRAKINIRSVGKGVGEIQPLRGANQPGDKVANGIPPSPGPGNPHRLRPTRPGPQPRDEKAPRVIAPKSDI